MAGSSLVWLRERRIVVSYTLRYRRFHAIACLRAGHSQPSGVFCVSRNRAPVQYEMTNDTPLAIENVSFPAGQSYLSFAISLPGLRITKMQDILRAVNPRLLRPQLFA